MPPRSARHVQSAPTLAAARLSAMSALRVRSTATEVLPRRVRLVLQVSTGKDRQSTRIPAAAFSALRVVQTWISIAQQAVLCATQASTQAKARPCALSAWLARLITISMRALRALRALLAQCGWHAQATPSVHATNVRWVERTRTVTARHRAINVLC